MKVHCMNVFLPSDNLQVVPAQGSGSFLIHSPGSGIADGCISSRPAVQSESLALCPDCKSMRKPGRQVSFPLLCEVMEVRGYWQRCEHEETVVLNTDSHIFIRTHELCEKSAIT